jgi:predicted signal transduction protein with EAL and GGDEF domain
MSIGIAFNPSDGKSTDELMKNADMAMYRAKEEGRDNYKFFSMDMNKAISRKMALENGLRKALKNNEFVFKLSTADVFTDRGNCRSRSITSVEYHGSRYGIPKSIYTCCGRVRADHSYWGMGPL